jgi:hypothetical protein
MHKLFKVLSLTLIATALALTLGSASLFAANLVRLEPVVKPVVDGDSVAIKVYVTNEDQLSAFSLGFRYDASTLDISSAKAGPGIPAGTVFKKTFKPADNMVLMGFISFDPELVMEPSTDVLVFTMYMKVPLGTGATCINIDSAFIPPAGFFVFAPAAGGSVYPTYQHDPEGHDIDIAGGCTVANAAPVVSDIPSQTIAEGSTFATISLDTYVSDVDNTDAEMIWTYSGNSQLLVQIVNRVATITLPSVDWTGSETITFRATDPGGLFDLDPATFTVTAAPVNDPPVVAGIPDQSLAYGAEFATINLDSYVADPDNGDEQMTWTYSGNSQLTVSISLARVATIYKPSATWSGSEAIIFTATDPGGLPDSDTAIFSIAAPVPTIKITPDTLTFSAYTAGANPAGLPVMVTNIGTGTFDWTASEAVDWLSLSSASGTAPSGFTVNISITGLTAGTYTGAVSISSAQANNSPRTLVVILNVHNPVDIKLTPDSLGFYARQLGANPGSQSVSITNGSPSGIAFEWSAAETAGWLALSATTGTVPSSVTFSVDIAGLTPGDYSTLVIIEQLPLATGDDGITDDIDTVKVTLKVDIPTGVDDNEGTLPSSYNLAQNYPNPFNPSTVIEFNLPTSSHVTLTVFNILGQKVTDILDEYMTAGSKTATWGGKDASGKEAESGVYFYRLNADNFNMTRKMMLLK